MVASKPKEGKKRRRGVLAWLLRLRGSPQAIALGIAVGTFVAFTPTVGFQIILAALLATLLSANRPAAIAMVWVTNPLTIPPIYAFTYWVGSRFWPGPPPARVREALEDLVKKLARFEMWEMIDQLMVFATLGREILVPLVIGGVLVGTVAGGSLYLITKRVIERYRRRRKGRAAGAEHQ